MTASCSTRAPGSGVAGSGGVAGSLGSGGTGAGQGGTSVGTAGEPGGSGGLTGGAGTGGAGADGSSSGGGGVGVTGGGGGHSGAGGRGGQTVRACADTPATPAFNSCRSAAECGPTWPVKCCVAGEDCWPDACPFPPIHCPAFDCTTSDDCQPGGTCVSTIDFCPRCEFRTCQYPPPPCTPDSCGSDARCQSDGTCKPVLCTDGYTCQASYRCNVASARADGHGCELVPCDDGWTCTENMRCTNPSDPLTHGCRAQTCVSDGDCDCGYCVEGACAVALGRCSFPPS